MSAIFHERRAAGPGVVACPFDRHDQVMHMSRGPPSETFMCIEVRPQDRGCDRIRKGAWATGGRLGSEKAGPEQSQTHRQVWLSRSRDP